MDIRVDANDVIERLTKENADLLRRAIIAETARDTLAAKIKEDSVDVIDIPEDGDES